MLVKCSLIVISLSRFHETLLPVYHVHNVHAVYVKMFCVRLVTRQKNILYYVTLEFLMLHRCYKVHINAISVQVRDLVENGKHMA